ncbi:hypothetical protein P0Y35_15355 [Kiritimatiellaeota bacterium B1221]|nr:hypothetical protein [Kiritimatiellaeota bacterium B1221]
MKILTVCFALFSLLMLSGCGGGSSSAPAPAKTADAAVMQVIDSLNDNNAAGPWDMLPASYQTQLTGVKDEFATKMDPDVWNSGADLVKKLHTVLVDKKELLLASPLLESVPMKEDLSANYDQLVAILGEVSESDLSTLEGLKNMEIGEYLRTTGSAIMAATSKIEISETSKKPMGMNSMLNMPGKMLNTKAELVSEDGDSAVVKMMTEGEEPQEIPFVKVEGKWIPADLVEEFPEMIAEMRESLGGFEILPESKAQVQMGMTMISGVLDQVAAAKTQEELQGALMGIMMMGMGM